MREDLLQRYYAAFTRGESMAMLDLLHEDVVHEPSQGTRRDGKAAFAMFLDHMSHCYREEVIDPVFLTSDDGSHGAAEFMLNGTYLRTDSDLPPARGQAYRLRVGAFFLIRAEKIARVSNHYNLADWLAQIA